jgi:hypothetical protein
MMPNMLYKEFSARFMTTNIRFAFSVGDTACVVYNYTNEPLEAKGPPLVGEEVRKTEVGKLGS